MATRIPMPDGLDRDTWADRLFSLDPQAEADGSTIELDTWRQTLAAQYAAGATSDEAVIECRRRLRLDRFDSIDRGPLADLLMRLAIRRHPQWAAFLTENGR